MVAVVAAAAEVQNEAEVHSAACLRNEENDSRFEGLGKKKTRIKKHNIYICIYIYIYICIHIYTYIYTHIDL